MCQIDNNGFKYSRSCFFIHKGMIMWVCTSNRLFKENMSLFKDPAGIWQNNTSTGASQRQQWSVLRELPWNWLLELQNMAALTGEDMPVLLVSWKVNKVYVVRVTEIWEMFCNPIWSHGTLMYCLLVIISIGMVMCAFVMLGKNKLKQ